jgi:hypothetical protein
MSDFSASSYPEVRAPGAAAPGATNSLHHTRGATAPRILCATLVAPRILCATRHVTRARAPLTRTRDTRVPNLGRHVTHSAVFSQRHFHTLRCHACGAFSAAHLGTPLARLVLHTQHQSTSSLFSRHVRLLGKLVPGGARATAPHTQRHGAWRHGATNSLRHGAWRHGATNSLRHAPRHTHTRATAPLTRHTTRARLSTHAPILGRHVVHPAVFSQRTQHSHTHY